MTLTINDTTMTSDQTAHTARLAPGSQHLWEVSWLPGRALDRNSAITAMTLADLAGDELTDERHRLWPFIQGWAAELGLTGSDAVAARSQPPGDPSREHEPGGGQLQPGGRRLTSETACAGPITASHRGQPAPTGCPRRASSRTCRCTSG